MKSGVKGALFTVLSLGVSLAAVLLSSFLLARSEASPDKDGGVDEELAKEAMRLAANKLPIKCKFITKEEKGGEQ